MPSTLTTLEQLLDFIEKRRSKFLQLPLCTMLAGEPLRDAKKRRTFLACARRFSINFQRLLFLRQGLCTDPRFYDLFLQHLNEEIGHDKLLADAEVPEPISDTLFEATITWFNFQMVALDNVERAVLMHLVLEVAGDAMHALTTRQLSVHVASGYFDVHAELDAGHSNMVTPVLQDLTATHYQRLGQIAESGWDMIDAVMNRCFQLMEEAP